MRLIRKTIFWLHLIVGLLVGLGVALMAGTGAVMAFEHPILDAVEKYDGRPPNPQVEAWSVENLLARVREIDPATTPTGLTYHNDPNAPAEVQIGRDRVMFFNAYTGELVGTEATRLRSFFKTTLELHRWLTLSGDWRPVGKNIMGAAAIGFLVLILSGLWLWMPRRVSWKAFKSVVVPSLSLKGKARDWNWHNALGFWLLIPLLVITLSGIVIAYPWATALAYRAVGDTPPPPRNEGGPRGGENRGGEQRRGEGRDGSAGAQTPRPLNLEGLNDLWFAAQDRSDGWTSITMRLGGGRRGGGGGGEGQANTEGDSGGNGGGVQFVVARGDAELAMNRTTLTFNRRTGELVSEQTFESQTPGRQLRSMMVPIHRGEVLGHVGRAIALIACLAALVLVYTGFALSWRRFAPARKPVKRAATADRQIPQILSMATPAGHDQGG